MKTLSKQFLDDIDERRLKEYLARIGRAGGQVKSERKREAVKRNLELARARRWPAKKSSK